MEYKEYIGLIAENKIKPVCIMSGDEEYVKSSVIERLKKAYVDESMLEFDLNVFDNQTASYDNIALSLSSPAMFSERKIVIAYIKPDNAVFKDERFLGICEALHDDALFVLNVQGKLDRRLALIKKLEAVADNVVLDQLEHSDIIKWILQRAKQCKKKISGSDAEYLLSLTGEDLYRLENEIAKLADYTDSDTITHDDIEDMVSHTPEHGVFLLVDAVAAKKTSEAVKQCRLLLADGAEAFQLLALLERQYQLILRYLSCAEKNMPQKDIMSVLALKPFVYDKLKRQASMYSVSSCKNALQQCLDLDFAVKSGKAESKSGFEMLIVHLAMK